MADILELSSRMIDSGELTERPNRITLELSELADDIAIVESFSHVIALRTDDGLVLFDTSHALSGSGCVESLRRWTDERIHTIVYTHGHVDHVGGSGAFVADNAERGPTPQVVGHENVRPRFERYRLTDGYNTAINQRQFSGGLDAGQSFLADDVVHPSIDFVDQLAITVGATELELRHDRGETDDHAWTWIPSHRAVAVGDLFMWVFPNAGNPQKVQRYPAEWARALRSMAALEPELILPAHGLPVTGTDRVQQVLGDTATALEGLVHDTLALMNDGAPLDTILHQVRVPDSLLAKPYLQPTYDEPEFTVRNIWRLYGGWYDGNPSRLKPPPDGELAAALGELIGGVEPLIAKAHDAAAAGNHRLACSLIETAVGADPESTAAHGARAEIYAERRRHETSLMARGIFGHASRQSATIADPPE